MNVLKELVSVSTSSSASSSLDLGQDSGLKGLVTFLFRAAGVGVVEHSKVLESPESRACGRLD